MSISRKVDNYLVTVKLPREDMEVYNVDGQMQFPMPGTDTTIYLIRRPKTPFEPWLKYGITLKIYDDLNKRREEIDSGIVKFKAILDEVETSGIMSVVNLEQKWDI